jgi:hypothetical protein
MMHLLYLLAFLFVAFPASAEPISLAILGAAAVGTWQAAALTTLITVGIGTAVSFGLGALQKAMAPKPKAGEPLTGIETSVQIGGDVARQIVTGKCAVKGHLVYHNTYGANNGFYQQVFVLSDWVSAGLDAVWIDGLRYVLNVASSAGAFTEYQTSEAGTVIRFRFYDGSQTGPDGELVSNSNPAGKWGSNAKLTGLTYVVVVMEYVKDHILYQSGIPKFTFEIRGAKLFDPRLSTETGGSGGHVWGDKSTYAYTENPAVIAYNYQRGFYKSGQLIIGMGTPVGDLLHDTYFAAANICDESVTLDAGGTETRYRCSTILTADQSVSHGQHLDAILSTMAGYLYDYSGFYYIQAGAGYASSATILDSELVLDAPVTYAAKRSRAELFNRVHGQFLDPSNEFQPNSYTPQVSASGVLEDYEELGRPLDLLSVPSQFQAERIAQIRLRESRRQATASITLGFHRQNLQAGDWITWASDRFGTKTWRIQSRSWDSARRNVTLELSEIDANVFSWSTADEGGVVPIGGKLTSAVLATTIAGFNVQAVTVTDSSGNEWPGLRFTWAASTDPTIDAVVIEYRKVGTTNETSRVSDFSPDDGFHQVTNNVFGGFDYEARATITTNPPRVTTWTGWVAVSTAETTINVADFIDEATSIPDGLIITSAIEVLASGEVQTLVTANWNDITEPQFSYYTVEIKEGAGNFVAFSTDKSIFQWRGIPPGTFITVRVRAYTRLGNISGYSLEATHTVAINTTAPDPISALSGTGAFQTVRLSWTLPAQKDVAYVEVWESTTNDRGTATLVGRASGTAAFLTGRTPATTYYYWIRAFNTSGIASTYVPSGATSGFSVTTASLAMTDFGTGLKPIEVVGTLPVSSLTDGRVAFLTTDKKLYRYDATAGAWTKAVDGADLVANTVTAGAIAAGAIIAEKLAIGTYASNLILNGGFEESTVGWEQSGGAGTFTRDTGNSFAGLASLRLDRSASGAGEVSVIQTLATRLPVEEGQVYEASVAIKGNSGAPGGFYYRIHWYDAAGGTVSTTDAFSNYPVTTSWVKIHNRITVPATVKFARIQVWNSASAAQFIYVDEVGFKRGIGATIIQDGAIVTAHMTANTINGDRITTDTLDAAKITAGSVLANTVIVEGSGLNMANVTALAADPAARVNAHTTTINPGKILIDGGTTLASWRYGSDLTKIDGGNIGANTISANKVTVGNRGIAIAGLNFEVDKTTGIVNWSSGIISYINDSGTAVEDVVGGAGHNTGGAFTYFYWAKGTGSVSFTTSIATAAGANNVLLATYGGGSALNAFYGNTIIDGDRILTNTIQANRIQANSITATQLASSTLITTTAQIGDLTVGTIKVANGAMSNNISKVESTPAGGSYMSLSITTRTRGGSDTGTSRLQATIHVWDGDYSSRRFHSTEVPAVTRQFQLYVTGPGASGVIGTFYTTDTVVVCDFVTSSYNFETAAAPGGFVIESDGFSAASTYEFRVINNSGVQMMIAGTITELAK